MGLDRNFRKGDYVKVVKSWEYDVENGIPFNTPIRYAMDLLLGGKVGRIDEKCTPQYCWVSFDCVYGGHIYVPYFALEKVEAPNQTRGRTMSDERKWIASDGVTELRPGMLVLVRDTGNCNWTVGLLSHCQFGSYPYITDKSCFEMCLPLEGNEHMAGTALSIPRKEKPFEWGEKVLVWDEDGEEKKVAIFICDYGNGSELRYNVLTKGGLARTVWKYCIRAPLDADAEQE